MQKWNIMKKKAIISSNHENNDRVTRIQKYAKHIMELESLYLDIIDL
jgi:hypothetical protein